MNMPFDLFGEKREPRNDGWLLSGDNKTKVIADISELNKLLDEACLLCPAMPKVNISAEKLVFNPRGKPNLKYYIWMQENPNTPTGRPPKYSHVLHYSDGSVDPFGQCIFGELYYTSEGALGKAEICVWQDRIGHFLKCALRDGALHVIKIDESHGGNKYQVYPDKEKSIQKRSSVRMKCPKCGSENVNVQVVNTKATTSRRGCLWQAGRVLLIICTCGLWLLVGKSKGKTRIKNASYGVCQNCGNRWKI